MAVKKLPALRIPSGWKDQARSFVIQLQRILDDIYQKIGKSGGGSQSGVEDVKYTSPNLIKTVSGSDSTIVSVSTLKSDMNLSKSDVGLGNVENKSGADIRAEMTAAEVTNALGYTPPSVDTKNTAGTTKKQSTKLFLVGAETQATNPQTNSNEKVYIGTDNCLYSNNSKVVDASQKGAASGVAELDANGLVPTAQLPSYVDDVLEYASTADFPLIGETGKIYVALDTNLTYRWSGSAYVEISPSLALGETSSTAYRGDRGADAYAHAVTNKGSAFASGLYKITTNGEGHVTAATAAGRADIAGTGILRNGTDYNTAGHYALDAATGYILGQDYIKAIKSQAYVAVQSGSDYKLSSGTNATAGDFIIKAGILGRATDTITGGTTVIVEGTNWTKAGEGGFNALLGDIGDKADKVSGATNGNFAGLDSNGNLTDSGSKASDFLTSHQDISGKADKVSGATNGNFAGLDASGNLTDSGHKHSDYLVTADKGNTRVWYGVCSTAGATQTKEVTITGLTSLQVGDIFHITFEYSQSYNGTPKLKINSLTAANIYRQATTGARQYIWVAGANVTLVWDGTAFNMISGWTATTTYYGLTRLETSNAFSTNTDRALTPNSLTITVQGLITEAPQYSASSTYAVGDRVRYSNHQWQCKTAITTAEAWNENHWNQLPTLQAQIDEIQQGGHVGAYTWGELAGR